MCYEAAMAYLQSPGPVPTVKLSASHLPGNLAVLQGLENERSLTLAVAHRSCVSLAHLASGVCTHEQATYDELGDKDAASFLTQVRWCRLHNSRIVLVLTSYKGFKIMEWNASSVLYSHHIDTLPGSLERSFARGVTAVGDCVCVGTSTGAILVFQIPAQGTDVALLRQLQGHMAPICDITTNQHGEVASCDESGMIIVWTDPLTSPDSSLVIDLSGDVVCLSLCFWNNTLIGGFTNGKILLFNADSGAKTVEISAHARCINALDVAPETGLLLSVSEDCTAAVWMLPTDRKPKVSLVFSTTIPNSLLCGGKFCDPRGAKFILTAYDSEKVFTFNKS